MTLPASFLTTPLAHRGLHDQSAGRPENSRAAFAAAMAGGWGIELDVQGSADNQAMVFHDDHLARLTRHTGPVRRRSAATLGAFPLIGSTEGIPTLTEVLNQVAGQVPVLIEIKDQTGQLDIADGALEQAVATALDGYRGDVAVMSFNPHTVVAFAALCPDVPVGLTTCAFDDWGLAPEKAAALREITDYDRVGACFISHDKSDLANARVSQLKSAGAGILCWTIRSPGEEIQARRVAHNITFESFAPVRS